jgi:FdhE protein
MTAQDAVLNALRRKRPEWEPWLGVVAEIFREAGAPMWDAAVPAGAHTPRTAVPLLAGATLALPSSTVRRLWKRLIRIASRTGTMKMATLEAALRADADILPLFTASVCQDSDRIEEFAAVSGVDAEALHAVVGLLPVPLLHACNRRWASSISESWLEGYCPVCAAWPAFAEVRGIERSRFFRCSRCGGEWHARALWCPYCDTNDHDNFVALVPENGGSSVVIDGCTRCLGYVKTLTRLQGCPPDTVMVEDLASVELDVAALQHGYQRPSGAGHPLEIKVTDTGATRHFFAWSS